jgi:hypothetical protein
MLGFISGMIDDDYTTTRRLLNEHYRYDKKTVYFLFILY